MKPYKYIDIYRTKKGKLRTWEGHIRALKKLLNLSKENIELYKANS